MTKRLSETDKNAFRELTKRGWVQSREERIVLDEPLELKPNVRLLVTVLPVDFSYFALSWISLPFALFAPFCYMHLLEARGLITHNHPMKNKQPHENENPSTDDSAPLIKTKIHQTDDLISRHG